jgi:hypothetical protein
MKASNANKAPVTEPIGGASLSALRSLNPLPSKNPTNTAAKVISNTAEKKYSILKIEKKLEFMTIALINMFDSV